MGGFAKHFTEPDGVTKFPHGREDVVNAGGLAIARDTFEPGWRWSNDIKPLTKTDSCRLYHEGYMLAGHLHVETDDGLALDIRAGDVYSIEPGHDGWVVGDESVVMLDWTGKARDRLVPVKKTTKRAR
jgi:hypothetical protein